MSPPQHRAAIANFLDGLQAEGHIAYGLHSAATSIMTCLISSYQGDHVHFVDGADGGYALAAKQLKAKLGEHSDG